MSCLNNKEKGFIYIDETVVMPGTLSSMQTGKKPVKVGVLPRGGLQGQVLMKCTDRDYDYYWDTVASLITNANNGLSISGGNTVQLGGALIKDTTITATNYNFTLSNAASVYMSTFGSGCGLETFRLGNINGSYITNRPTGIATYFQNNSVNYQTEGGLYITDAGQTCIKFPSLAFKYDDNNTSDSVNRLISLGDTTVLLNNNVVTGSINNNNTVEISQNDIIAEVIENNGVTTEYAQLRITKNKIACNYDNGTIISYNFPTNKIPVASDMIIKNSTTNDLVFIENVRQLDQKLILLASSNYGALLTSFNVGWSVDTIIFTFDGASIGGSFDYTIRRITDNVVIATGTCSSIGGQFIQTITTGINSNTQLVNDSYILTTSNVIAPFDFTTCSVFCSLKLKYKQ